MEPEVSLGNFVFSHFFELDEDVSQEHSKLVGCGDSVKILAQTDEEDMCASDPNKMAHDVTHFNIDFKPDSE